MAQLDLQSLINAAATKYGVPPNLLAAVFRAESSNNPNAVSPKGAQGIGQLMPATAKALGVVNPMDAAQNIDGSAKLLGTLLKKYRGNVATALAAYNAGEPAVDTVGGIPNFPETIKYIQKVTQYIDAASKTPNFQAPPRGGTPGASLPGDYISQERGGKPPPGVPQERTPVEPRRMPGDYIAQDRGGAPPPIVPRPTPQPPARAVANREEGPGLARISDAQMQAVLDAIAMEQQGVPLDMSRQFQELQPGPYGMQGASPLFGRVDERGGFGIPSLASFYSGGTAPGGGGESGGLGWLSKLFRPSGGPTFTDYTPREG